MKKIVSVCALCALLVGVMVSVTGCGGVRAGQVYEVTRTSKITKGIIKTYWCFHSDGHVYTATKIGDILSSAAGGTYKITSDSIIITHDGHGVASLSTTIPYKLEGEKLSFTYNSDELEMIRVSSPTEKEIKDACIVGKKNK